MRYGLFWKTLLAMGASVLSIARVACAEDLIMRAYAASCRVQTSKARGSATIIYSKKGSTYALTNHHVVEGNIEFKTVWDSLLKREVKREFTSAVEVLFPRIESGRVVGYATVMADVVAYDAPQDIAVLKFRDSADYPYVAMYPRSKAKDIPFLTPVACIGAALGEHPIVTFGHLNGKQHEIDNHEYWLSTAQSIFGNSGGAIIMIDGDDDGGKKLWFIGIPSRISLVPLGFGANVVTHMGFFIPVFRIYDWLESQYLTFLWDSKVSEAECERVRKQKREKYQELLNLPLAAGAGEDKDSK